MVRLFGDSERGGEARTFDAVAIDQTRDAVLGRLVDRVISSSSPGLPSFGRMPA